MQALFSLLRSFRWKVTARCVERRSQAERSAEQCKAILEFRLLKFVAEFGLFLEGHIGLELKEIAKFVWTVEN